MREPCRQLKIARTDEERCGAETLCRAVAWQRRGSAGRICAEHLEYMIGLEKRGILFASGPLGDGASASDGLDHPARGEARKRRARSPMRDPFVIQRPADIRDPGMDDDGGFARAEGEFLRSVDRDRCCRQSDLSRGVHANNRLCRRRQDRNADLRKSDQERLSRRRLSPQLARPISRRSAACRRIRRPMSAPKRTSSSPACRPTRRLKKSCRARTGWCTRRGRARSWSSSARIRFRSRNGIVAPLAAKGAAFLDGEVERHAGHGAARARA